jgi:TRAP-type C4-dicarboxylate transport system permease large subunit
MQRLKSIGQLWGVLILVLIIFGGIYSGFISPTEAGGLGAFAALIVGLVKGRLSWKVFRTSVLDAVETSGMVFLLLIGAWTFSPFLSLTTIPQVLIKIMSGWNAAFILLSFVVFYFVCGLFFESVIVLMITITASLPIWTMAGFDLVWLGVIVVMLACVGNISPPFALIIFVVSGMVPEVPISKIFKPIIPFVLAAVAAVVLVIFLPQIATFLPTLMNPLK